MANEPGLLGPVAIQQLKDVVRIVLAESPPGGVAPPSRGSIGDNRPVLLGKTTAAHGNGDSQDVAIYSGDTLGSETDTGLLLDTYNRFADLEDDVWVHIRGVSRGWEILSTQSSTSLLLGKTVGAISKSTTGFADLYDTSSTKGAETVNIGSAEVYNRFADVADGSWVIIVNFPNGLELISAEC